LPIHRFLYLIPLTSKFVSEVLTWSYKSGGLSDIPQKSCSGVPVNKIPGTVTPRASPPSSSTVSFLPSSSVFLLGSIGVEAVRFLEVLRNCFLFSLAVFGLCLFLLVVFFFSSVWPLPLLFAA
jgi:hypothetical protein